MENHHEFTIHGGAFARFIARGFRFTEVLEKLEQKVENQAILCLQETQKAAVERLPKEKYMGHGWYDFLRMTPVNSINGYNRGSVTLNIFEGMLGYPNILFFSLTHKTNHLFHDSLH